MAISSGWVKAMFKGKCTVLHAYIKRGKKCSKINDLIFNLNEFMKAKKTKTNIKI